MSHLSEALRAFSPCREQSFWQSRSNLRNPPDLVDLEALARMIRSNK